MYQWREVRAGILEMELKPGSNVTHQYKGIGTYSVCVRQWHYCQRHLVKPYCKSVSPNAAVKIVIKLPYLPTYLKVQSPSTITSYSWPRRKSGNKLSSKSGVITYATGGSHSNFKDHRE
jgi:hypothetical protein